MAIGPGCETSEDNEDGAASPIDLSSSNGMRASSTLALNLDDFDQPNGLNPPWYPPQDEENSARSTGFEVESSKVSNGHSGEVALKGGVVGASQENSAPLTGVEISGLYDMEGDFRKMNGTREYVEPNREYFEQAEEGIEAGLPEGTKGRGREALDVEGMSHPVEGEGAGVSHREVGNLTETAEVGQNTEAQGKSKQRWSNNHGDEEEEPQEGQYPLDAVLDWLLEDGQQPELERVASLVDSDAEDHSLLGDEIENGRTSQQQELNDVPESQNTPQESPPSCDGHLAHLTSESASTQEGPSVVAGPNSGVQNIPPEEAARQSNPGAGTSEELEGEAERESSESRWERLQEATGSTASTMDLFRPRMDPLQIPGDDTVAEGLRRVNTRIRSPERAQEMGRSPGAQFSPQNKELRMRREASPERVHSRSLYGSPWNEYAFSPKDEGSWHSPFTGLSKRRVSLGLDMATEAALDALIGLSIESLLHLEPEAGATPGVEPSKNYLIEFLGPMGFEPLDEPRASHASVEEAESVQEPAKTRAPMEPVATVPGKEEEKKAAEKDVLVASLQPALQSLERMLEALVVPSSGPLESESEASAAAAQPKKGNQQLRGSQVDIPLSETTESPNGSAGIPPSSAAKREDEGLATAGALGNAAASEVQSARAAEEEEMEYSVEGLSRSEQEEFEKSFQSQPGEQRTNFMERVFGSHSPPASPVPSISPSPSPRQNRSLWQHETLSRADPAPDSSDYLDSPIGQKDAFGAGLSSLPQEGLTEPGSEDLGKAELEEASDEGFGVQEVGPGPGLAAAAATSAAVATSLGKDAPEGEDSKQMEGKGVMVASSRERSTAEVTSDISAVGKAVRKAPTLEVPGFDGDENPGRQLESAGSSFSDANSILAREISAALAELAIAIVLPSPQPILSSPDARDSSFRRPVLVSPQLTFSPRSLSAVALSPTGSSSHQKLTIDVAGEGFHADSLGRVSSWEDFGTGEEDGTSVGSPTTEEEAEALEGVLSALEKLRSPLGSSRRGWLEGANPPLEEVAAALEEDVRRFLDATSRRSPRWQREAVRRAIDAALLAGDQEGQEGEDGEGEALKPDEDVDDVRSDEGQRSDEKTSYVAGAHSDAQAGLEPLKGVLVDGLERPEEQTEMEHRAAQQDKVSSQEAANRDSIPAGRLSVAKIDEDDGFEDQGNLDSFRNAGDVIRQRDDEALFARQGGGVGGSSVKGAAAPRDRATGSAASASKRGYLDEDDEEEEEEEKAWYGAPESAQAGRGTKKREFGGMAEEEGGEHQKRQKEAYCDDEEGAWEEQGKEGPFAGHRAPAPGERLVGKQPVVEGAEDSEEDVPVQVSNAKAKDAGGLRFEANQPEAVSYRTHVDVASVRDERFDLEARGMVASASEEKPALPELVIEQDGKVIHIRSPDDDDDDDVVVVNDDGSNPDGGDIWQEKTAPKPLVVSQKIEGQDFATLPETNRMSLPGGMVESEYDSRRDYVSWEPSERKGKLERSFSGDYPLSSSGQNVEPRTEQSTVKFAKEITRGSMDLEADPEPATWHVEERAVKGRSARTEFGRARDWTADIRKETALQEDEFVSARSEILEPSIEDSWKRTETKPSVAALAGQKAPGSKLSATASVDSDTYPAPDDTFLDAREEFTSDLKSGNFSESEGLEEITSSLTPVKTAERPYSQNRLTSAIAAAEKDMAGKLERLPSGSTSANSPQASPALVAPPTKKSASPQFAPPAPIPAGFLAPVSKVNLFPAPRPNPTPTPTPTPTPPPGGSANLSSLGASPRAARALAEAKASAFQEPYPPLAIKGGESPSRSSSSKSAHRVALTGPMKTLVVSKTVAEIAKGPPQGKDKDPPQAPKAKTAKSDASKASLGPSESPPVSAREAKAAARALARSTSQDIVAVAKKGGITCCLRPQVVDD